MTSGVSNKRYFNTVSFGDDARLKIEFEYDVELIEKVKTLSGRSFHNENNKRFWTIPFNRFSLKTLGKWGFRITDDVKKLYYQQSALIKEIKTYCYDYQIKGVAQAEKWNGDILIADEMGLGKTLQALSFMKIHPEFKYKLIVCPSFLKLNWGAEIEKWYQGERYTVLSGQTPFLAIKTPGTYIINYDIIAHWKKVLKTVSWDILIMDEVHRIKNPKALRTKAVKSIGAKAKRLMALTGTPIVNRPIEIYTIVRMLKPYMFNNYMEFIKTYCNAKFNGFAWDCSGASNLEELHKILTDSIMIRRLKKDVLKELPDKQTSTIKFTITNRALYDEALNDFLSFLEGAVDDEGKIEKAMMAKSLVQLSHLRRLAAIGKIEGVIEWIENFLESGKKLIVFGIHRVVLGKLYETYKDISVKVDGSVSSKGKHQAVLDFQNKDDIKLFIGNIQSAGVGLTLTEASDVAFIEYPQTPADYDQAVDRAHRIGQKNSVNIWRFVGENTVDEDMLDDIFDKRSIQEALIDGKKIYKAGTIKDIIYKYSKKK